MAMTREHEIAEIERYLEAKGVIKKRGGDPVKLEAETGPKKPRPMAPNHHPSAPDRIDDNPTDSQTKWKDQLVSAPPEPELPPGAWKTEGGWVLPDFRPYELKFKRRGSL